MRRCRSKRRGVAAAGSVAAYAIARSWFVRWGATPAEEQDPLRGDELIAQPTVVTTRAITIDAPADAVWPWLVQMGQDRGGLYSYDWLESLFGLEFHNADRIVPEWQHLEVGDIIRSAPASAGPGGGFAVVGVEPGRSIVTVVGDPAEMVPRAQAGPLPDGCSWAFVLQRIDDRHTRLLVRLRARFGFPGPAEWLAGRLLEPVHFVMERKQLLGIKSRAERAPSSVLNGRPIAPPADATEPGHPEVLAVVE